MVFTMKIFTSHVSFFPLGILLTGVEVSSENFDWLSKLPDKIKVILLEYYQTPIEKTLNEPSRYLPAQS